MKSGRWCRCAMGVVGGGGDAAGSDGGGDAAGAGEGGDAAERVAERGLSPLLELGDGPAAVAQQRLPRDCGGLTSVPLTEYLVLSFHN